MGSMSRTCLQFTNDADRGMDKQEPDPPAFLIWSISLVIDSEGVRPDPHRSRR
jgi:hypothetical protein